MGKAEGRDLPFDVVPIPGDVEVLQILVEDREELPIYISASEEQILCIAYLFEEGEIKPGKKAEMHDTMLKANISVPLSSFGIVEERYVIFGALSVNSSLEDILHEIEMLSSNTLEAIDAMRDFLI
jgi:uncharacterized protein YjfI (DUF2170 family)